MQHLANGLTNGLQVALLGLSFALVYRACGVLHLAMGGIFALVPFVAWSLTAHGSSFGAAALVAVLASSVLSLGCDLLNHRPLERRGAAAGAHTVSSLGLFFALSQFASLVWSDRPRAFPVDAFPPIDLGLVMLGGPQAAGALVALGVLATLAVLANGTGAGLLLRAVAAEPLGVALLGRSVGAVRGAAFAISGVLTGVAALSMAFEAGFDAHRGLNESVLGMAAMIVGGGRLLLGTVLAGLALGLTREGASSLLGARWQDPATFMLFALFLHLRRRRYDRDLAGPGAAP